MVSFRRFLTGFPPCIRDLDHTQITRPTAMRAARTQAGSKTIIKTKEEMPAVSPSDQLARWMSARIDRAAQMNSSAPTVVVTAADSSEYRTAWAP